MTVLVKNWEKVYIITCSTENSYTKQAEAMGSDVLNQKVIEEKKMKMNMQCKSLLLCYNIFFCTTYILFAFSVPFCYYHTLFDTITNSSKCVPKDAPCLLV